MSSSESGLSGTAGSQTPRKLIIFADGTGNAFSQQESNVWRLYQILDRTRPDQKSIYIQGVGTSGNAIISKLDSATGFGVPSNVRKLYSFLCWNWLPGDEIYMFGFSRGAFTIRCLAGLIASQGLMPREIDERPTTTAELNTNVMGAWRAYRSETAPFKWADFFKDVKTLSPTVAIARHLRDFFVLCWRKLWRCPLHGEVRKSLPAERGPGKIPIKFLGLFDTVEAYGLPVEEFRAVVNWAVWPISFRNRRCNPIVKSIRHALSLDDERTTFHPIRFDQSKDGKAAEGEPPRTREIWFAGMHSDIGGGYADDSLALVPFSWMVDEARAAGLRFDEKAVERLKQRSSPLAQIHDSREGLACFYRYDPRRISSDEDKDGGPPVIHHAVAQKIAFGTGGYAPIGLPKRLKVLAADGRIEAINGSPPVPALSRTENPDEQAIRQLQERPPRQDLLDRVRVLVLWRRIAYFLLMLTTCAIALLPVLGPFFEGLFNPGGESKTAEQVKASLDTLVIFAADWAGTLLPGFASPWIDASRMYPSSILTCLALWAGLYIFNTMLRNLIRDNSYEAWTARDSEPSRLPRPFGSLIWLDEKLRVGPIWQFARKVFSRYIAPAVFTLAVILLLGVALSRTTMSVLTRSGYPCPPDTTDGHLLPPGEPFSKDGFSPNSLCWPTDVTLQKGQTYTLWIDPEELFVDQTIVTSPGGFRSGSWVHYLAEKTLRRSTGAAWFQPIAQIGRHASAIFALEPADGRPPSRAEPFKPAISLGLDQPWSEMQEPDKARFEAHLSEAAMKQAALSTDKFVTRFIAPEDGPLYLYVNDAVPALPLFGPFPWFYDNNAGKARVTVIRDPLPPAAEKKNILR